MGMCIRALLPSPLLEPGAELGEIWGENPGARHGGLMLGLVPFHGWVKSLGLPTGSIPQGTGPEAFVCIPGRVRGEQT